MITSVQVGVYILSSLTPASRNEEQNYGFIINHLTNGELVRWNTGSILNQNLGDLNIENDKEEEENTEASDTSFIAFKAVRYNVLGELDGKVDSCKKQIETIVQAICTASGHTPDDTDFIIHEPIIR